MLSLGYKQQQAQLWFSSPEPEKSSDHGSWARHLPHGMPAPLLGSGGEVQGKQSWEERVREKQAPTRLARGVVIVQSTV